MASVRYRREARTERGLSAHFEAAVPEFDLHLGKIDDPKGLAESIGRMTGVVDHGLFIGLVHEALLAENGDVRIWRKGEPSV